MLRNAATLAIPDEHRTPADETGCLPVYGFTRAQLRTAFDAVVPESHWKDPIRAAIRPEMLRLVAAAVVHYTATEIQVESYDRPANLLIVRADGYRAGPAGDH